jgi:hypothetical protein
MSALMTCHLFMDSLRHLRPLPSSPAGFRSTFDRLPYGCLLFMYRLDLTPRNHSHMFTPRYARPRGRSQITHIVSTYVLSSPEGSENLALSPRRDQRVGGRRSRRWTPLHTSQPTHRVLTRHGTFCR